MLITTKEKFEKCKERGFVWKKINDNFYIVHLYGNKENHPIGYYIPILVILRK